MKKYEKGDLKRSWREPNWLDSSKKKQFHQKEDDRYSNSFFLKIKINNSNNYYKGRLYNFRFSV
jgi:hypothetical protein